MPVPVPRVVFGLGLEVGVGLEGLLDIEWPDILVIPSSLYFLFFNISFKLLFLCILVDI